MGATTLESRGLGLPSNRGDEQKREDLPRRKIKENKQNKKLNLSVYTERKRDFQPKNQKHLDCFFFFISRGGKAQSKEYTLIYS